MSKNHISKATRATNIVVLTVIALALLVLLYFRFVYEASTLAEPAATPSASQTVLPPAHPTEPTEVPIHEDYYVEIGPATVEHDAPVGEVFYEDLDELGRTMGAYSWLTTDQRAQAKAAGRQEITVDPAGWGTNFEATITSPFSDDAYSGWFWNRSHLIADSLGGDAIGENLVTGTRTQNVGVKNDHSGGMAHTEILAREFLDNPANADCPLYYAAVPNYEGNELVPRTVTVDIQSCDKSIDHRVVVFNEAYGFTINYATGEANLTS